MVSWPGNGSGGLWRRLALLGLALSALSLAPQGVRTALGQANGVPRAAPTTPVTSAVVFDTQHTQALSLFGAVKYPADFSHFDYVNPEAPKGGRMRLGARGSFDTFNPFTTNGTPAAGAALIYDTLMTPSLDEPSSEYGLLAESVEVPDDYSWVTYTLRKGARWHDGTPVTPEDVIFSLEILRTKGAPQYRFYYANIVDAKKVGPRAVKFTFDRPGNRELPLITGQLVILPKHYWEGVDAQGQPREFGKSTLEPPLGSGPYRIGAFEPGRYVELERVKNYWGQKLPVRIGQNNFDVIRYEYYRDDTAEFQAFLADEYDIREEFSSKSWATQYNVPAVKDGRIKKRFIKSRQPAPMQGFFFNTRESKFQDRRVREAIGLAFNFEWANKYLFYGQYKRLSSYFDNSELAARGLPTVEEFELLAPYKDQLPPEIFTQEFKVPKTDGTGKYRNNLVKALKLLNSAGWSLANGVMTNETTGEVLNIEFLLTQPSFERVVQPFLRDLERIGIFGTIRIVDVSQYLNRRDKFDFDVIVHSVPESLSPGNEQRDYWGSETANQEGSRNVAGIHDPVVDAMIDKVIFAKNRAALVTATHALDRVLLWGYYVVPQWYVGGDRYAYWNRFDFPAEPPPYNAGVPDTWWSRAAAEELAQPTSPDAATDAQSDHDSSSELLRGGLDLKTDLHGKSTSTGNDEGKRTP